MLAPSYDVRPPLLVRLFFGLIGLVLLTAAVLAAMSIWRFEGRSVRTEGTITALRAGGSHPTIEFTAADGTTVRFNANGLIFGYRPGDRVHVLYNMAEPQRDAALDAVGSLWAWPIMLSTIGLIFVLFATLSG